MEWSEYMVMAARHSKNNARHWFRYLRKYINSCGTLFSKQDVEYLNHCKELTPFQRVSIKAAFEEGSQTQLHIISLNQRISPDKISKLGEISNKHDKRE